MIPGDRTRNIGSRLKTRTTARQTTRSNESLKFPAPHLKHFPPERVPSHIQVLSGQEFASNTTDVDPETAARTLGEMPRRRANPKQTPHERLGVVILFSVAFGYGMALLVKSRSPRPGGAESNDRESPKE